MSKVLNKVFNSTVKVLDDQNMIIDHCISDELPDRAGDVVYQDGIDNKEYMANPVVLDAHNYEKESVGKCLKLYRQGNQTRAQTQFAPTDEGKKYYALYKDGFMKAFSIGFIPLEYSPNKSEGYDILKSSLLEYSVVSVPCNPRALKTLINKEFNDDIENMEEDELKAFIETTVNKYIRVAIDNNLKDYSNEQIQKMIEKNVMETVKAYG